jgi:hypothetical protein
MENQEVLLRLFKDVEPLKKTLASDQDYRKLRFDFDDICGFMDDKVIHIYMKYKDSHPYEEMKALAITSMYRVKPRLFRNYMPMVDAVPDFAYEAPEVKEGPSDLDLLLKTLSQFLSQEQLAMASAFLAPPTFIVNRVLDMDSRIPSRLFLEYFDVPIKASNVKRLNKFRRKVEKFIKVYIDPRSLKVKPEYLSLFRK